MLLSCKEQRLILDLRQLLIRALLTNTNRKLSCLQKVDEFSLSH